MPSSRRSTTTPTTPRHSSPSVARMRLPMAARRWSSAKGDTLSSMPIRVLLVDDDPEFRRALQQVLEEAGFHVLTAADGAEALKILDQAHDSIDVAIIDLNLPHVSGFEIIGAITRRPTVMGVVATSGVYNQMFLEVARHLGAHIAIPKTKNHGDFQSWIPAIRSILKAEDEMGFASGPFVDRLQ